MNKELLALSRFVLHHWTYLEFLGERNEDRKESDYGASGEMKEQAKTKTKRTKKKRTDMQKQAQDEKGNKIVCTSFRKQLLPWQLFRHFDPVFPKVTVPDGHNIQELCASWSWYWSSGHARQSFSVK